jgi:hypothetical protein
MARKTTSTTKAKPRRVAKVKSTVAESTPAPSVKQRKSIFSTGTLIAILLLIALIELTVYLKNKKENAIIADATPISAPVAIFKAEDGVISSIEIKPADGDIVKVARNAENVWAVEMPIAAEADQDWAEAAAAQISALQVISPIDDGKSPSIFGLDNPAFIITIEFQSGEKRTLEVGDATPSNSGYYVRLDKDKIMIADLSGISSLLQLAAFPPYLNTPTPTALPPTPTPVPPTSVPPTEASETSTPAP